MGAVAQWCAECERFVSEAVRVRRWRLFVVPDRGHHMSLAVDMLVRQVREYERLEWRPLDPSTPKILQALSDEDLDRLCDAVHDEGRRRGFGTWWYE